MTHPHVAIDARLWGAFWTGTGSYLRGIVRALAERSSEGRYTLVLPPGVALDGIVQDGNWQALQAGAPHVMDEIWEQLTLPTELAARGVEVLFAPGGTVPLARSFAAVPVVHDLGFLHRPEFYEAGLRAYLAKWVGLACRTAEAVVCNSEFTRRSVAEAYGVSDERCCVIHPAPDPAFRPDAAEGERAALAERHGIAGPYVLTVSSGGPNKNLPGLLAAMELLRQDAAFAELRLVVVGPEGAVRDALASRVPRVPRGKALAVGRVPAKELAALYRCADLFLFPSLYEGFGLPPLEAMACGTPVVASDRAALPEVLGKAALLCDPLRPESIAGAAAKALSDGALRASLRRAGIERAGQFSWRRSAEELTGVFEEAAARR